MTTKQLFKSIINTENKEEQIKLLYQTIRTSHPQLLIEMESSIMCIFQDGRIDALDVPYLVNVLKKLSKLIKTYKCQPEYVCGFCCVLMRHTVDEMVKQDRIDWNTFVITENLNKLEKVIISCFEMIDDMKELIDDVSDAIDIIKKPMGKLGCFGFQKNSKNIKK